MAWFTEYKVRKLFGLTHWQYLDEPEESMGWMLNIDRIVNEIEAERAKPRPEPGG